MRHVSFNILVYTGLALLEATAPAMVVTMLGLPGALPVFVVLALLAALAELPIQGRVRLDRQRPLRVLTAAALSFGASSLLVGGPAALLEVFFGFGEQSSVAYLGLLGALYVVWRGINLTLLVDEDVRDVFGRNMLAVLGILLVGVLGGAFSDTLLSTFITGEVLLAFTLGLLLVAFVRQHEAAPEMQRIRGWHNLAPVLGATLLIIMLSLGLLGLLGANAAKLLNRIIISILLLIFTIIAPLLDLILRGFIWVFERLNVPEMLGMLQNLAAGLAQRTALQQQTLQDIGQSFPWLSTLLHVLEIALPILAILLLVWFFIRRQRRRSGLVNEERESLFSWEDFRADLADLVGRLRKRADADSLELALARLQGESPAIRVRRSYIKMLIAARDRSAARSLSTTPREYQPQAQAAFPEARAALQTLTSHYERARYHADTSTAQDATEAEAALADTLREGG